MASADIAVQIFLDLDQAGRCGCISIAGNDHGIQNDRKVDFTHQVTEERHGTFQNPNEDDFLACIIFGDLLAHFANPLCDLFSCNQYGFDIMFQIFHFST